MKHALPILGALAVCLAGCASVTEKVTGWLSSNVDAIGVLDGRVMQGQANFASEREATMQLQSMEAPSLTCFGALRYTATHSGVVDFSCNDGRTIRLAFQSLGRLSGSGRGWLGQSEFALTYGLPPAQAASFLALPIERLVQTKK